ncbi:uncharacterized protein LOC105836677 [Monomorium pharaonis]|uniref:uncharacterized protein LOC105836677 n=1 Tax=Monomorium pharaonis TaxID=307658 RepID=UPI00063F5930|nr:uncharacterized protein LOC105836677 [Monomorium pharaonis]
MDLHEKDSLTSSADGGSLSPSEGDLFEGPSTSEDSFLSKLLPLESVIWYCNKDKDTTAGTKTKLYLDVLNRATSSNEPEEFYKLMLLAEKLHTEIGCDNSVKIWKRVKPILTMCSRIGLNEIAREIALYLYSDPESVSAFIHGFNRLRISDPFLKQLIRKKRDSLI